MSRHHTITLAAQINSDSIGFSPKLEARQRLDEASL